MYAAVNLFLFLINWLTNPDDWWFYYPLLGWGSMIAIHAAVVFEVEGRFGHAWEERKVRELMVRDSRRQGT